MFSITSVITKVTAYLAAAAAFKDAAQVIPEAVTQAEAFVGPGNGQKKLEYVKAHVTGFLAALGHTLDAINATLPLLVTFVTSLVTIASSLGINGFTKKDTAPVK